MNLKVYNHSIQQRSIGHLSPIQALKEWQQKDRSYSLNGYITKRVLTIKVPLPKN